MPQTCCCLANPVWNHSQDSDPLTRNLQSAMAKQFPLRIAYEKQNHLISIIHLSPLPPSHSLLQCGMVRSGRRIRTTRSEPLQPADPALRRPRRLLKGILERVLLQHRLDQDQCVQLRDAGYNAAQLLISHLDEAAVLLLRRHRIILIRRHPVVRFDLGQRDPLVWVLLQHAQNQLPQLGTVLGVRGWELNGIGLDFLVQGRDVASDKRHVPVDQGVQRGAQSPNVGRLATIRVLEKERERESVLSHIASFDHLVFKLTSPNFSVSGDRKAGVPDEQPLFIDASSPINSLHTPRSAILTWPHSPRSKLPGFRSP